MSGKRFLKLWSTRTLHSTTKPACFRRLRFFQVHTPRLWSRTIGWQIWIKHAHKGIIRRSLQRFILISIIMINKRVSEGCIFKCTIDSRPTDTSLLLTPYHCRQEASPRRNAERNDWKYSRYYRLSLLRKCGHFHNPPRDISLLFSLAIADTSS